MLESISSGKNVILNNKVYLNLRTKFFFVFFILVIIPFLILGIIAYQRSKATIENNFYSLSMTNMKQTSLALEYYLSEIRQFTETVSKDLGITSTVIQTLSTPSKQNTHDLIPIESTAAAIYGKANSKLKRLFFISGNYTYLLFSSTPDTSSLEIGSNADFPIQPALNNPDTSTLLGTNMRFYKGGSYDYAISVLMAVRNPETGKVLGVLLADFDYDSIVRLMGGQKNSGFKGIEIYVTDETNNIMYSTDEGLLTLNLNDSISNNPFGTEKPIIVSKDGKKMYQLSYRLPLNLWKTYVLIPSASVSGSFFAINSPFIIFILICLILVSVFPIVLLSMFFKPLSKLSIAISGHESSDFSHNRYVDKQSERNPPKTEYDNTPYFDGLINKVYYSRLKQKEVQLVALQNQINPHFLYNTLESIRGAALHHGIQSIASMAKNLSSFFRYSIGEEVLVPIKDEIQHLENYIAIQNFRHDDKFELVYKLPEELYDYKILKLTLQPLVENSIKHGLEMKIGKGKIKIDIMGMESIVKIRIFDDGIGMPPEKTAALNRNLEDDIPINKDANAGTGVGVRNVNSRIKLYFGKQYGLRYLGFTEGTTVEVTFPAVK